MENSDRQILVMIIGLGRIGKVHFKNLQEIPQVKIKYVVDVKRDYIDRFMDEFSLNSSTIGLLLTDLQIAYNDPELDAVIVCTPTSSHEEHVTNALKAGKAVMCEKPLSFSMQSIIACYDIAKEKKLHLLCALNRRFDPQMRSTWLSRKQVVGNLKSLKFTARDHPMNSADYLKGSGGMCLDQLIHDIDLILWFTQQLPVTVYAIGHAFVDYVREMDDVDQVYVTMKFPDGSMGHVDGNREAVYGHDNRAEIFGDRGMIVCDNQRSTAMRQYTAEHSTVPPIMQNVMERYVDSYRCIMRHFIRAVQGHEELQVKSRDVLWATLICEAAYESLVAKQPVVVEDYVKRKYSDISF